MDTAATTVYRRPRLIWISKKTYNLLNGIDDLTTRTHEVYESSATTYTNTQEGYSGTNILAFGQDNIKHQEWLESIEEYWRKNEEHNKIICRGRLLSKEKHKELPNFSINVINKTMNRRMMNGRN